MGDAAWWLPKWLDRILPPISIEGGDYFERIDAEQRPPSPSRPSAAEVAGHPAARHALGERGGVGADQPEVGGSPLEPSGPSVSAQSCRRPWRRPRARSPARASRRAPPRGRSPRTPSLLDLVDELAHVPGGRLRLRRQRRDHRADHLDAVAVGEVAERVVGRDELALGRRDAADAARDLRRRARAAWPCRRRRSALIAGRGPPGRPWSSASRIAATARITLRGSCHQCGSSPSRWTESISVTCCGVTARRCRSPRPASSSRSPPERKTTSALAIAAASLGRGSYSCGSELGRRIESTETRSPPTLRTRSATCVVVATAVTLAPDCPLSPQPATSGDQDGEQGRAGGARRRRYTAENRFSVGPSPFTSRRRARLPRPGWSSSPSACGASSSPAPAAALGLVLGNIRLPAVLLVASSPPPAPGQHRHLRRRGLRRGARPHPRRPHQLAPVRLDGAALDGRRRASAA